MSKDVKNIDDLFKSNLASHQVKAPAHVRRNVLSKTSKFGWRFWSAAIVIVGLTGLGIWYFSGDTSAMEEQYVAANVNADNTNDNITDIPPTSAPHQTVKTNITIESENTIQEPETSLYSENATIVRGTQTPVIDQSVKTVPEDTFTTVETKNSAAAASTSKAGSLETEQQGTEKSNRVNKTVNVETAKPKSSGEESAPEQKSPVGSVYVKEKANESTRPDETATDQAQNSVVINPVDDRKVIANPERIENAPGTNDNINEPEKANDATSDITASPEPDSKDSAETEVSKPIDLIDLHFEEDSITVEPDPEDKTAYWMTGVNGGVKINNGIYNGGSSTNELNNFLAKNQDEKLGYFAEINTSLTLPGGLTTGLGLGYENQSFKTSYWTDEVTTTTDSTLVFSHVDIVTIFDSTQNQTITYIDSVFNYNVTTSTDTSINSEFGLTKANYLTIPVTLGYQFQKKNWLIGASAGLQVNYLLNKSGTYYINNQIIDLANSENTIFAKMALQYNLSAFAGYNFTSSPNLFATARLTYAPGSSNYYNPNYGFRQVNAFQLGFGLSWKF